MKRTLVVTFIFIAFLLTPYVVAQNEAGPPVWQVTSFDISVNLPQADRVLGGTATINATNVGGSPSRTFTVRIAPKASVKTAAVTGTSTTFRVGQEVRGDLQKVEVALPSSIGPGQNVSMTLNYSLPVEINSGLAALTPESSQFLPLSFWYPMPNTAYTVRGVDAAPFRLIVNAPGVVASGVEKSSQPGATSFEQSLNAQPFFVKGDWEKVEGTAAAQGITVYVQKGVSADEKKQAESLTSFAGAVRSYFTTLLGPAPTAPIRLVSVRRGAGFGDGGTILVDDATFRRPKLDATTALAVAEGIARMWIGGQTPVRGEGNGLVHDGLVRFVSILAIEKQLGREAAQAELLRSRLAYSSVSHRDGPLSHANLLDSTYFASVPNRGAVAWRLIDQRFGRDAFIDILRSQLASSKSDVKGLTLGALRAALVGRGGETLKTVMDQQFDQVIDTDLLVGLPQQRGSDWVSALRNLGSIDVTVSVVGITDRGERLITEVTIPSKNFADAVFKATSKLVRVEVDPDKIYPQLDFGNDVVPRVRELSDSLSAASLQLAGQDYVKAEATAREAVQAAPQFQEARIMLARALLGQNKIEDAEKTYQGVLNEPLPTPSSIAWANLGLGEISMKRGQAAEAAKRFTDAVHAGGDYASSLAARAARLRAEAAANNAPPIDESARTFITGIGPAIVGGKKADLESRIASGELVRFINATVGTAAWETRVLRTEQQNANLMEADVSIRVSKLGKEGAGTAVMLLSRSGGGWKLSGIDLFEVQ
jgi:hypothetical protein